MPLVHPSEEKKVETYEEAKSKFVDWLYTEGLKDNDSPFWQFIEKKGEQGRIAKAQVRTVLLDFNLQYVSFANGMSVPGRRLSFPPGTNAPLQWGVSDGMTPMKMKTRSCNVSHFTLLIKRLKGAKFDFKS